THTFGTARVEDVSNSVLQECEFFFLCQFHCISKPPSSTIHTLFSFRGEFSISPQVRRIRNTHVLQAGGGGEELTLNTKKCVQVMHLRRTCTMQNRGGAQWHTAPAKTRTHQ